MEAPLCAQQCAALRVLLMTPREAGVTSPTHRKGSSEESGHQPKVAQPMGQKHSAATTPKGACTVQVLWCPELRMSTSSGPWLSSVAQTPAAGCGASHLFSAQLMTGSHSSRYPVSQFSHILNILYIYDNNLYRAFLFIPVSP